MKICIITNKYPNETEPNILVFVQQLVWQFADLGHDCTVICPMAVNLYPEYRKLNYRTTETTYTGKTVTVFRPKYFSLGQTEVFGFNPGKLSTGYFTRSAFKTIKKNHITADAIYSHFITPAGIAAARIGRKLSKPAFVAHGEATMMTINDFGGARDAAKELASLTGVIAVSSHNKKMLVENEIMPEEKIAVFPNGYNPLRFSAVDKSEARERMGFDRDSFIVGFVGSFDDRKGIMRLQEAVDGTDGVKFACAGKGKLIPTSRNCILKEPVGHANLKFFYNACDVFALPTRMEGCCNAIVEALACGVPVISSDRLFNHDILDDTDSILIDPDDVSALREAIIKLRDDRSLREQLSRGCLSTAQRLTIQARAQNIIRFMTKGCELYERKSENSTT